MQEFQGIGSHLGRRPSPGVIFVASFHTADSSWVLAEDGLHDLIHRRCGKVVHGRQDGGDGNGRDIAFHPRVDALLKSGRVEDTGVGFHDLVADLTVHGQQHHLQAGVDARSMIDAVGTAPLQKKAWILPSFRAATDSVAPSFSRLKSLFQSSPRGLST